MAKVLFMLFALAILSYATAVSSADWDGKPRSCVEVRDKQGNKKSGFYGLYDSADKLYTTYCDLETEPSFAWTLVESLSFTKAKLSTYRKYFYANVVANECSPNWSEFRLSRARMDSVRNTKGSTFYRVTCNFEPAGANRSKPYVSTRDYLRIEVCRYPYLFNNANAWYCGIMDYFNVRGYSCRQCSINMYIGSSYHTMVDLTHTAGTCDKFNVPDRVKSEYVFGDYRNPNTKFSCENTPDSTTNWWIGGPIVG